MLDLDKFAGHTPGPWEISYEPPRWIIQSAGVPIGKKAVSWMVGDYVECRANAHLSASAPELLAEVKRLRKAIAIAKEFLEDRFDTVDGDDGQPDPNAEMRCHTEIQMALGVYP